MPSAFVGVVRSVVRELDHSGELIPVDSLRSSSSFQPYCLLSRKPRSSWFWKPRFSCVNLSIRDILAPDAPVPDLDRCGSFHFSDAVDGQLQGSMGLASPGQGKISGGAAVSGSSSASMNVCTLRVDPNIWETLHKERRLRKPEPKILKQLRSCRDNVYVVTEVLQTQEVVKVTRTSKQEGSSQFALPGSMCLQGESQGHLSRRKTVTIPAGSVLAFRVAQLVIDDDWDILLVPDEKQRTFSLPSTASIGTDAFDLFSTFRSISDRLKNFSDAIPEERAVTGDFQGLQAEVEAGAKELQCLEKGLRRQLLGALASVLRDPPALHALQASLEQGLRGGALSQPLDGPASAVLDCLVLPSRALVPELASPVFYLLGALIALSETQCLLLADALDAGALPGPLRLVRGCSGGAPAAGRSLGTAPQPPLLPSRPVPQVEHLLQQSAPWQEPVAVSWPPGLLGGGWGEGAPAWALLEECGLELQAGSPQASWEPQAQGAACALYASLALLCTLGRELC